MKAEEKNEEGDIGSARGFYRLSHSLFHSIEMCQTSKIW